MSKKILITIMALAFSAMSTFSFAATLKVPATHATITAALAAAAAGDVISVAGGTTYAENVNLGVLASIKIRCSSLDSTFTITGGAAGDVITIPATALGTALLPTTFENVVFDISANAAKVAADAIITTATGTDFLKFYNCTFKGRMAAPVTTDLVEVNGDADGWQVENCTFTFGLAGTLSNALSYKGAGDVTNMDIIGNTFTGAGAGAIATDARAVNVDALVASFTGFYFGGNTANKAGIVMNFDSATGLPVYAEDRIYDNVFTRSLAFTMIDATLNGGGVDCWNTGQLLIKGNHFGSLTTEGDTYYAIMFDNFNSNDFAENNVHINNNNFQYPMTNGTDTSTWGGHVTANKTAGTLAAIDAKANFWGQITGPLTAYEDGGIAVVKTTGAPYDYTSFISTYAVPQIDETNRGIEYYDYDNDGYLDRVVIWFDQYLDPASLSYDGWTIAAPYEFDTAKAPKLSIDNDSEGTPDGVFALTLYLKERTVMDTGVKPELTYAKATGIYTGITGNINAKVNNVLEATATEHDKAKPVVKSIVTTDTGLDSQEANNGDIDGLILTFSEAVTVAGRTLNDVTDFYQNVAPVGFVISGASAAASTVTLFLTEAGTNATSGSKPNVAFTKDGSDDYTDTAGNYLNAITFTSTADGAAPVATKVETGDANADGYIDQYKITFSENIAATAVADTAKVRSAFTNSTKVENTLDFTTATLATATNTLTITGRSLKDASALGHPWDTNAKPEVKYVNAGGVKDAAGLQWVYFWDAVAVNEVTTYPTARVVDSAKPIIARATGQVNSKNLYVTFSEPVQEAGTGNLITGDFTYYNVYNTGLNGTAVAAMGADADATDANATVTLTMDENLKVEDVVNDSLSVATTGSVMDLAAIPNFVNPVVKVTINDVIAPTLVSAITQDVDNDGWIDHIKLTFSEVINDAGINGYNGTDKISLNASTWWAAAGYTVVGLNFVTDGTEQNTATTDANTRGLVGVFDEKAAYDKGVYTRKVINVGDIANDNILWLSVAEGSGPDVTFGDTDAKPVLTITGGGADAMVGDYKPNYLATVTSTPSDKAGAALMAAEFRNANTLRVWLSEGVADSTILASTTNSTPVGDELTTGDFTINVGIFGNTVSATGKDVTQVEAGIVDLFFITAITTADNAGWVGITNTTSIHDNAGNYNTQNVGLANMAGYKTIVAWDGTGSGGTEPSGPLTAPSALAIADVTNDNGNWFIATFTPSTDTRVSSYQFYRLSVTGADSSWIFTAQVPKLMAGTSGKVKCYVPTPVNGSLKWAVVASSGSVLSDMVANKEGDIAVAELAPAGKLAEDVLLSGISNVATGGAIDNIKPSNLSVYAASDNPGAGTGILVSWTAPADHGIVGWYGTTNYSFPIYGATSYQIFRRTGNEVFALIGSAPAGSTSYIDNVADGTVVYTYRIKPTDGTNFALQTGNSFAMANANANIADFSSDGKVDFTDFTMFASVYGTNNTNPIGTWINLYDLAPNGKVDFDDFTAFAANYGFGSTKAAKEIAGVELPVSNVSFTMDANVDASTSMYYVNVNISDFAKINGFDFKLAYDSSALKLDSVNGLVGLPLQSDKDGVIDVASMFNGEQFNGTVTLGFKSNGINSNFVFELTNALVSENEIGISQVTKLSSVTAKALPQVYTLSKNYPNPFNPTTTIEYAIPSSGKVELVVYNMAGQKVRTMVNETKEAGFFKTVWDGRNDRGETVASGLYFYKLVSGKFNKIEKMTLVK